MKVKEAEMDAVRFKISCEVHLFLFFWSCIPQITKISMQHKFQKVLDITKSNDQEGIKTCEVWFQVKIMNWNYISFLGAKNFLAYE